jgi:caa(3)-type oxidase subunit IV
MHKPAAYDEENMSEQANSSHGPGSARLFLSVWLWLVAITAVEVYLGYETDRFTPTMMLTLLVLLSIIKAVLIVSYFMHLKYEKLSLTLILIPSVLFCLMMAMIFFFPDSWRLLQSRLHGG